MRASMQTNEVVGLMSRAVVNLISPDAELVVRPTAGGLPSGSPRVGPALLLHGPVERCSKQTSSARRSKTLGFTTLVRLKKTISGDFVCFRTYGRAGSLTP